MATAMTTTENSLYGNLKHALQNGETIEGYTMHDRAFVLTLDELVPMFISQAWRNKENAETIASNKQFSNMHKYQLVAGSREELQNIFVMASGHDLENAVKVSIESVNEAGILMAGLVGAVACGCEKTVKIISEHKLFNRISSSTLSFLTQSAKESKFEKIANILSGEKKI